MEEGDWVVDIDAECPDFVRFQAIAIEPQGITTDTLYLEPKAAIQLGQALIDNGLQLLKARRT